MSSSKLLLNSALRAAAHVKSSHLPEELVKSSAAFLSSAPSGGKFTLPDLPYDYNALEREFRRFRCFVWAIFASCSHNHTLLLG
jgi:hypothetical protein